MLRVKPLQFPLNLLPVQPGTTVQTPNAIQPPVQVYDFPGARPLVQTVDILGDGKGNVARLFKFDA